MSNGENLPPLSRALCLGLLLIELLGHFQHQDLLPFIQEMLMQRFLIKVLNWETDSISCSSAFKLAEAEI